MSDDSLDERYLNWLVGQVASVKTRARARTHWSLLRQMHATMFAAIVARDENRTADAKDLRYEFLALNEDEPGEIEWIRSPCSMLELFIILSRKLAFDLDEDAVPWFWHLIETLELEQFNDRAYDRHAEVFISNALDRVIWRTYSPDGQGGLFPLRDPSQDQRRVELWYQLQAYLLENF